MKIVKWILQHLNWAKMNFDATYKARDEFSYLASMCMDAKEEILAATTRRDKTNNTLETKLLGTELALSKAKKWLSQI